MIEGPSTFMNGSLRGHSQFLNDGDNANGNISRTNTKDDGQKIGARSSSGPQLSAAVASTLLPQWLNLMATVILIFGGCCSNVFVLESIIKEAPGSGTLITCFQFILITLFTLPSHLDFSRGIRNLYLKPRAIPFTSWMMYTVIFATVNLLNNKAFHYKISVPLHIILRSAGPVTTMTVHRLIGKRFEKRKIAAVLLLFLGVVLAAIADAHAKDADIRLSSVHDRTSSEFWTGFGILYLALMLSALLGIFTDRTYAKYGRGHSDENLFYSHTLSLPFILSQWSELSHQTRALLLSPPSTTFISDSNLEAMPSLLTAAMHQIPIQVVFLIMNGLTQYLCIRGVNQLAARSSSLTVGIVLNIRKLVSLLLSIWLFGNRLAPGVLMGAALVFVGGGLYAIPSSRPTVEKTEGETKKEL
jgi:solute carrier family 35 (UDP-xylose/UDP-N-acetylglucosamine transporter), member B4